MNANLQAVIDGMEENTRKAVRHRALAFYRDERACHTDPVTETVDPSFPSYPQWQEDFWADFFANRKLGASLEEVEAISDQETEEAEAELEALAAGTLVPAVVPEVKKPVKATVKKKAHAKKTAAKKAVKKVVTKAEIGRGIVARMLAKDGSSRANIIAELVTRAKMTPAGASTFYQSVK